MKQHSAARPLSTLPFLLRAALAAAVLGAGLLSSPAGAGIALLGPEIPVNETTTGDQLGAVVAAATDGSFAVVWTSVGQDGSSGGVYLRRFAADGTPLGPEQQVNTQTTGDQTDPDLAFLASGDLVVVWDSEAQDGDLRGIYGQIFSGGDEKMGGEFQINVTGAGDQNDAVVAAAPGGGFLVAWETNAPGDPFEDLLARLFDADGLPASGEIAVNQTTAGDQEDLDLAAAGTGFVAVWESDGQGEDGDAVVARLLGSDGQPGGDEIAVNVFTQGDQHGPDVAVRSDGSFVVAWQDDGQGADPQAFLRGFAADGSAVTAPFPVEDAAVPRFLPRLALGPDGGPVAVWISEGEDGSGAGSRIRSFDAAGEPHGAARALNLETAGNQVFPHLALSGTAGLAVWDTDGQQDGSGLGVFARRFALPFFADGFESGDLSAWSSAAP